MTEKEAHSKLERLCELWDLLNRAQEYPAYYGDDEIKEWEKEHRKLKLEIIVRILS